MENQNLPVEQTKQGKNTLIILPKKLAADVVILPTLSAMRAGSVTSVVSVVVFVPLPSDNQPMQLTNMQYAGTYVPDDSPSTTTTTTTTTTTSTSSNADGLH